MTATPTATGTAGPTPTSTATSIAYPALTYSCVAEPSTNDSVLLRITVQAAEPAPSTASFRFEPTTLSGPIDNILQPGPFQLVNLFSGETSATSPGALTECNTPNACSVTYTLTETAVTREIGETVVCQF